MTISRRTIISNAVLGSSALLLAACGTTAPTASQIITDVNLLATGLQPVVAALSTIPSIPAAVVKQAQNYLTIIQADAKTIAASLTPNASTVQEVVQVVQALAATVSTIPELAPYSVVIQAAVALLPVILAQAGIASASVAPATMTPDQARSILNLAAVKR